MRFCFVLAFALTVISPLWPQAETQTAPSAPDPAAYIGMTLNDLISRFGVPQSVYASRGLQEWQDDVVFVYDAGDFYIIKDRVWQLGVKSAYLISAGDPVPAVFLGFGDPVYNSTDCAVFTLRGYSWPLSLRFNFSSDGKVDMIFIYRSDL
ncbi:MAG: hypothetical protein FWF22_01900 [Treponema sp.]|nr:hypothetical protein [Treponema sp.]